MAARVSKAEKTALPEPEPETKESADLFAPPPGDVKFSHQVLRHEIPEHFIDADARKVVHRLNRFGYEAFLVGGCVRDILFGQRPKDFDVATSALPAEIRRIFRNCRLIGRRFRLAHLFFKNQKIIEVATFRRGATSEDDISSRHAAENLFGGPADDAIRRDFSINALMYDVEKGEIHDFVGGLADIDARVLATIGDPNRRFPEDPVRIIRAIKFAVRLDLQMTPDVLAAAEQHAPLISSCAPARLVEEMYKVLRTGQATRCFQELHRVGVLHILMPSLAAHIDAATPDQRIWDYLEKADAKVRAGQPVSDALLLTALVYPYCLAEFQKKGDLSGAIHERIFELLSPMHFPKRCIATVRQILVAQRRLISGPETKRARRILDRDYALDAVALMDLTAEDESERELVTAWRRAMGKRPRFQGAERRCDRLGTPPKRRRRRRGGRRREPEEQ